MKALLGGLAQLLFVVSVLTLLFAAASYVAFKFRRRSRLRKARRAAPPPKVRVLEPYDPSAGGA